MKIISELKNIFAKEDLRTNDKLGVYPEKVHVPAFLERKYLKTSRILAVISIISLSLNILIGSYIYMVPPQLSAIPKAYTYDEKYGRFKQLENMYVEKSATEFIIEDKIREYIYIRNTVISDIDIMNYIWREGGRLYWMSGGDVFSKFTQGEKARKLQLISQQGYSENVFFRWSRRLSDGRWMTEYDTIEYYDWQRKKGIRKRWRAYTGTSIIPGIPYNNKESKLENPLNVVIVYYYVTSIPIKEDEK